MADNVNGLVSALKDSMGREATLEDVSMPNIPKVVVKEEKKEEKKPSRGVQIHMDIDLYERMSSYKNRCNAIRAKGDKLTTFDSIIQEALTAWLEGKL